MLPGLERRRHEEADVILLDKWPADLRVASGIAPADPRCASFVISVSASEIADIREAFREVGFEPGATAGKIDRQAVLDFQRHYGLTVDGLIGKQTLSTLQRDLDARRKPKQGGAGAAGGAAVAGGNEAAVPEPTIEPGIIGDPWITAGGIAVAAIAILFLAYLAWYSLQGRVIHRRGPWRSFEAVELATLEWVAWLNHRRLLEPVGNIPPAEAEARYYAMLNEPAMAA